MEYVPYVIGAAFFLMAVRFVLIVRDNLMYSRAAHEAYMMLPLDPLPLEIAVTRLWRYGRPVLVDYMRSAHFSKICATRVPGHDHALRMRSQTGETQWEYHLAATLLGLLTGSGHMEIEEVRLTPSELDAFEREIDDLPKELRTRLTDWRSFHRLGLLVQGPGGWGYAEPTISIHLVRKVHQTDVRKRQESELAS